MQTRITQIANQSSKSWQIYHELLAGIEYSTAHQFIKNGYAFYQSNYDSNPSINGRIFEYLICETLAQENIFPFYYQASFERVPNADFDVVLYHSNRPVVLTMKTSLRERYTTLTSRCEI